MLGSGRARANGDAAKEEFLRFMHDEEPNANLVVSSILFFVALAYMFVWVLFKVGLFHSVEGMVDVVLLGNAALLLAVYTLCQALRGVGRWLKYLMFVVMAVSALSISVITGYKVWMLFALPIILSCRYTNVRFAAAGGLVCGIFVVITGLCNVYVSPQWNLVDLNTVTFTEPVTLHAEHDLFGLIASAGIDSENLLFGTVVLAILPNLLIVLTASIAAVAITLNSQRLMVAVAASAREKTAMELELEKGRAKLMVSQIQPHFLYNTLTAIMAIDGNPDETVDAIGDFGKYLRGNLDSLTSDEVIPFSKEIQHVKRYTSLEQLRFAEKLDIKYDLQTEAFSLPALTLQVLVENAIKHGVSARAEGGLIIVSTTESDQEWIMSVKDNGLGFDTNAPVDETEHVGLANAKERLAIMCNGSLEVESTPGEGTTATVHIPKA